MSASFPAEALGVVDIETPGALYARLPKQVGFLTEITYPTAHICLFVPVQAPQLTSYGATPVSLVFNILPLTQLLLFPPGLFYCRLVRKDLYFSSGKGR